MKVKYIIKLDNIKDVEGSEECLEVPFELIP
jgi:hypothetical protein